MKSNILLASNADGLQVDFGTQDEKKFSTSQSKLIVIYQILSNNLFTKLRPPDSVLSIF